MQTDASSTLKALYVDAYLFVCPCISMHFKRTEDIRLDARDMKPDQRQKGAELSTARGNKARARNKKIQTRNITTRENNSIQARLNSCRTTGVQQSKHFTSVCLAMVHTAGRVGA